MADEADPEAPGTRTLAGARAHARRQADRAVAVPAATTATPEASRPIIWSDVIGPGDYASCRLPRGAVLRLEDAEGDACLQLLVHNARQPGERLNVADTVKVQWQAYLGPSALLLSDLGRALMTIVADTSGRHDCLCGCTTRGMNSRRYGDGGASGATPNGRDLLALGVAKLGLTRLDVGPNVNLFKSVRVDSIGGLELDGDLAAGATVELRCDMDVFVTMANTPHPLDDRPAYTATAVRGVAWRADEDDAPAFPTLTPERERAYLNTADHLRGYGA